MTSRHFNIAVVMATFRRPEMLLRCLGCLAKQTVPSSLFEVIVVSDGPDESTEKSIASFTLRHPGMHLRFCALPVKSGPAAARNAGWQFADAQLIAFTDDDCMPSETWLENYLNAAKEAEANFAFTGQVVVPVPNLPTDYEKNIAGLETADFVTANCCCPKHILKQVGGFDTRFEAAWREDSDLHFNLLKNGVKLQKIDNAVVVHPVRPAPWGVSLREQKKSMFNALLFKKHPAYYRQLIAAGPVWRYYMIILSFLLAVIAFTGGANTAGTLFLILWLSGVLRFMFLRLNGTAKTPSHVAEMFVTSLIIPFTSIFWTLYGSMKYKVLFL